MTKLNSYSAKGVKKTAGVNLPKQLDGKKNLKLLSQAIRVYGDRKHPGLSKTKTRSEIDLTKKKAYRQKGTGMARHGAKSAPIFVGGSKAHGPKGVKRVLSLPKKMKLIALSTAFVAKAKDAEMVAVSNLSSLRKTKDAASLIEKVLVKEDKLKKDSKVTFLLSQKNKETSKVLANLGNSKVMMFADANAYDIYLGGFLFVDEDAFGEVGKKTKKDDVNLNKKSEDAKSLHPKNSGRSSKNNL